MSESLLFAILGFLIACLFGTVFASFLWRRAVTVTKRRLGVTGSDGADADRNASDDPETMAEMQELRRRLGERDIQVRNLKSEHDLRNQDRAASEAEARDEVKRQLTSAARELEKAAAEKVKLETELTAAEARAAETEEALFVQNQRVDALEAGIRTLVTSANLPLSSLPAAPEEENEGAEQQRLSQGSSQLEAENSPDDADDGDTALNLDAATADETSGDAGDEPAEQADEADQTLVAAASQSLDDRIQALMQGQKPH